MCVSTRGSACIRCTRSGPTSAQAVSSSEKDTGVKRGRHIEPFRISSCCSKT
jgi:hypothetical protein